MANKANNFILKWAYNVLHKMFRTESILALKFAPEVAGDGQLTKMLILWIFEILIIHVQCK